MTKEITRTKMRIKAVLTIGVIVCLMSLIGIVSALDKEYISADKYGTIKISDKGTNLYEITLTKNTNDCIYNCYAEGTVKLGQDSKFLDGIRFYSYSDKKDKA